METKKIAVACFAGGALCCAVALVAAPVLWWLGILAGFAGGYISYEFREVLRAIPVALRAARRGSAKAWDGAIAEAREFFSEPHPLIYPAVAVMTPFYLWAMRFLGLELIKPSPDGHVILFALSMFLVAFAAVALFFEMTLCVLGPLTLLAFIGARFGEKRFWLPHLASSDDAEKTTKRLEGKGLQSEPLTYRNVGRWIAKGSGLTVLFFVWTLWKHLVIASWNLLCYLGRFAWHLVELIHSKERLLCGIDGAISGAIAYFLFATPHMSLVAKGATVFFGGLIGAALGVLNYEVVSKRILHVAPAR
jgi:hypothetical protein